MIGKMMSMGFDLATLPARLTWRSARALTLNDSEFNQFMEELRRASDEAAREIRAVIAGVDMEMSQKAGHLSPEDKQRAAMLALDAAEQHMSMAAVNMLRALWLSVNSARELADDDGHVTIDQKAES